jgi:DegV family protein with EDD domain
MTSCVDAPGSYSTFNSAWLRRFQQRVQVVDSRSFSFEHGMMISAARDALAGCSAGAIQMMLEDLRARTSVIFALDTLEWVRRGGRLARLLPLVDRAARTLSVKPVIEFHNGEFHLLGATRSAQGALQRIEDEVRARIPVQAVAAAYTRGCQTASEMAARLASLVELHQDEILITEAGAVFAVHAGPRALGAALIRA